MKAKPLVQKPETLGAPPQPARWPFLVAAAVALIIVFWAYGPSLHGEFLFDDTALAFALPSAAAPLAAWIKNVRPVLQFSYWINSQLSGDDPFSYHVINVLIHCIASGLIFLIVRRLIELGGIAKARRDLLAGLAAFIFLLHPVQTEAVAYLAGRSEALSTMFAMAAFAIFLYRREAAATWVVVIEVLAFTGLAMLSKEQTVALPVLLVLTDFWFNPPFSLKGILANWRLYGVMAAGGAAALVYYSNIIFGATTAGFGMKDFRWYQYFFTECRALFVYIREFFVPVDLRADWDFPISHTITEHGAIFGLLALVALVAAAWLYRRRFPLASYGFLAYLVLMAPTSSVLPIQDPIAERRLYFSMLGLLLIVVDLVSRIKIPAKQLAYAGAVVVLAAAFATHVRAAVWNDSMSLWQDTVQKSPNKMRARFQLAFVYFARHDYPTAIARFADAAAVGPPTADLLIDWGLAYSEMHQTDQALEKLRQAAALKPSAHVYSQIGQVCGAAGRWSDALEALNQAEKLDPKYAVTFFYRGLVYYNLKQCDRAVADYQRAIALDPTIPEAPVALRQALACSTTVH
ncbi:MAG TPA: tetratricopeptide repeat protein [Candidatus Sulfopaludibacter sp.]|jgi:tetratricopeptide (TPR) repeat protein|nr:tetratricopeptide repeat protein [Candidatus Sulfopaludibacter sp.]